MTEDQFTPEQSFKLISSIINEAKVKFQENGVVYVVWGLLVAFAAFTQYYLIQIGRSEISYYPYFLMPLGGLFSWFYYARRGNKGQKQSHLSKTVSASWIAIGVNVLILGFVFAMPLGKSLIPMILILIGIGITISSVILQIKLLMFSGMLMNLIGLLGFLVGYEEQPLLMGIANLLCVFLPGLILMIRYKNK